LADAGPARRSGTSWRQSEAPNAGSTQRGWWSAEPGLDRVAHGLSGGLDGRKRRARLRALGNAVVPQCAEVVGRVIVERFVQPAQRADMGGDEPSGQAKGGG
jgi:hypothetical protein